MNNPYVYWIEFRKYKSNIYVTISIFILNHTQVPAKVTMKESESVLSDMLREALGSLMTILGYVAGQSLRNVQPRTIVMRTYNLASLVHLLMFLVKVIIHDLVGRNVDMQVRLNSLSLDTH